MFNLDYSVTGFLRTSAVIKRLKVGISDNVILIQIVMYYY